MIYTSLFVRHWDTYLTENHDALWYGQLSKSDDGRWGLDSSGFNNLMHGTNLSSPIPPFGGTRDFDISENGVVFTAKDPELNVARYTKSDLYYVKIDSFAEKPSSKPQMIKTEGLQGYSNAPVFSSDGKKLAFLRMKSIQYEADKNRIMLVPDISDLGKVEQFYEGDNGEGAWDLSPGFVFWGENDEHLYAAAEKHARNRLWKLPASPKDAEDLPTPVFEQGSLSDAMMLGNGSSIFVTSKSLVDSSTYSILDPESKEIRQLSSVSENGKRFGLNHEQQVSEIWFPGSTGYDMHALVMTPSNFDSSKKYPLAFFIHGGPQGSWGDSWSTRWNPAIYAEQGYVVVLPNPTGSTGYGQDHVDAITDNWGGSPYDDLVNCFKHLEGIEYIDTENAVALGASYGGYMISKLAFLFLVEETFC
jgi:dipeptidyl aminopeptidase/acylaminoacyl peptidase